MQRMTMPLFWTVALLISACNNKADQVVRPPDFSFIFQHASCGLVFLDILDTNKNLLTQNSTDGTIVNTISIKLTDKQLDLIYQKIIDIDFFSYPSTFKVPDEQIRGYQAPSGIYQLNVIANLQTHSVSWTDEVFTKLPYMDEINLRELANLLLKIIWANPDYQVLIACA